MSEKTERISALLKRWLIAIVDVVLFNLANVIIAYISNNGNPDNFGPYGNVLINPLHFFIMSALVLIVNYLLKLYKSVWAYANTRELLNCVQAAIVNSIMLFVVDLTIFNSYFGMAMMRKYVYVLNIFLLIVMTYAPRISYRIIRYELRGNIIRKHPKGAKKILLVGAGFMGDTILREFIANGFEKYDPVAFIDDNPSKLGKVINGVKVVGNCDYIPEAVKKYDVDEIIICIPSAPKKRQNEIAAIATKTGRPVRTTPSLEEIIEDKNSMKKLRKIEITDLLSRDEIKLNKEVCEYLIGKTILVTGGGGSIGSELCKQCARYKPETIVIFDIYENCAFELQNELKAKYGDSINIQVRIGSVRDLDRLEEVFEEFHPDVVFHAAAHKHVPLMEDSPCEAVKNNVFGTYNVAITADKFKVPKMVILSTDKAVNPTNVMGATKRLTEVIIKYMDKVSKNTEYAAVRFGNVLGSHGSVVPIFKKQIEKGGPVTVTHPDITRYFMTIPEAAQLVCQAGGLAKGGEIFVLDMGEPVRIMDLAENLINLSGFTVDEIGIEITGLRPGEKLYEELSTDAEIETRQKTSNEKIFVNQPMEIDSESFDAMLNDLKNINNDNVRDILVKYLPNYHPKNNEE
ncbi:MAG: polysaccharide biosynthesis protein [Eubacterium sp.]|nr:polysaccharide biosynthesis protein [Eubacterium sp.]